MLSWSKKKPQTLDTASKYNVPIMSADAKLHLQTSKTPKFGSWKATLINYCHLFKQKLYHIHMQRHSMFYRQHFQQKNSY